MDDALRTITGVLTAIIGLAILAVILGQNSQTSKVIGAVTSGLANDIKAADGPVLGGGGGFGSSFGSNEAFV